MTPYSPAPLPEAALHVGLCHASFVLGSAASGWQIQPLVLKVDITSCSPSAADTCSPREGPLRGTYRLNPFLFAPVFAYLHHQHAGICHLRLSVIFACHSTESHCCRQHGREGL